MRYEVALMIEELAVIGAGGTKVGVNRSDPMTETLLLKIVFELVAMEVGV